MVNHSAPEKAKVPDKGSIAIRASVLVVGVLSMAVILADMLLIEIAGALRRS